MSEAAEKKIADLEQELRVAQELLFLVLDEVGEPVVIDSDEAKRKSMTDRMIDLQLEDGNWVVQVVEIPSEVLDAVE